MIEEGTTENSIQVLNASHKNIRPLSSRHGAHCPQKEKVWKGFDEKHKNGEGKPKMSHYT